MPDTGMASSADFNASIKMDLHAVNGGENEIVGGWRLLLVTALLAGVYFYRESRRGQASIPGPLSVPLIGSLVLLKRNIFDTMANLKKRYGDVYGLKIGSVDVVVLNGMKAVKEALVEQGDVFAGRPPLFSFQLASEGKSMVFNSYDSQWKVHRRLAEKALRLADKESGFLERTIEEELGGLMETFASRNGQPTDPETDIVWTIARAKYRLCYGGAGEENFTQMVKSTMNLIGCHNRGSVLNFFPWLRTLLFPIRRQIEKLCAEILSLTQREEAKHLSTYRDGRVRDCLDALIALGVKQPCGLEADRVMHTVQEYLGAGMDVVYITLYWTVLLLAANPKAQRRIQAEIAALEKKNGRKVVTSDMAEMTFTSASVHEIFRLSCAVPFSLPHSTIRDTEVGGVKIPRGKFVLVNLHSVNRDPEVWENPGTFNPGRFLTPSGQTLNHKVTEQYNAFGLGRRRCVGEKIAKGEIFLFIVRTLARFDICKPEGQKDYDIDAVPGVILRPKKFKVIFKQRRT